MMDQSIAVTGSRLEPRIDQAIEWSFPEKGSLVIQKDVTQFQDWVIPNSEIKDAVLNNERLIFKNRQSLLLDCGRDKYVFGLISNIEQDTNFPFDVRVTKKRSFMGKLMLFGIAIFVFNVVLDIVQMFI